MLLNWCFLLGLVLSKKGFVSATKYGNSSKVTNHATVKIWSVHFTFTSSSALTYPPYVASFFCFGQHSYFLFFRSCHHFHWSWLSVSFLWTLAKSDDTVYWYHISLRLRLWNKVSRVFSFSCFPSSDELPCGSTNRCVQKTAKDRETARVGERRAKVNAMQCNDDYGHRR